MVTFLGLFHCLPPLLEWGQIPALTVSADDPQTPLCRVESEASADGEIVERVEVYARGGMIRVYSKRYVMSLMGQDQLRAVLYLPIGMRPVCE